MYRVPFSPHLQNKKGRRTGWSQFILKAGVLFYYVWRIKYLLTRIFLVDIFDAPELSQLCASWRCQRIWKVSSPSFKSSKLLHVCQNCCIWYWLCVTFNTFIYIQALRDYVGFKFYNLFIFYVTWTRERKKIKSKWVSLKKITRLIVIWKISEIFLTPFFRGL